MKPTPTPDLSDKSGESDKSNKNKDEMSGERKIAYLWGMKDKAISVGFDAKRIVQNRTGLGNYSRYVVAAIGAYAPEVRALLSTSKRGDAGLYADLLEYPNVEMVVGGGDRLPLYDERWRNYISKGVLKERGIQLFHGLSNELPRSIRCWGVPSVVTMHDLIYELFPQYYKRIDATLYHHKYKRSCRDATHIIAVSENTKRDIVKLYGIPEERVSVIYQGCSDIFKQKTSEAERAELLRKYELPRRYLLSVGSIEERKNMGLIVEALALLPDATDLSVVLIGRRTKYSDKVERMADRWSVKDRLHIRSHVPTSDLPTLYQGAEIFIYPSLYEGFGIPILEALHSGVPVIGATGSCLEEAGGDTSLYCDPRDPKSLAEKISTILDDSGKRKEMTTKGHLWVAQFTPKRMAEELIALYRQLLSTPL